MPRGAAKLGLPLGLWLANGAGAFLPFAGVEELKPQSLHQFCSQASFPSKDRKSSLRRCQHSVRKTLEDGGEVEFSWRMHADPDRILSLDTEAERGVRLRRCGRGELELELPESHAQHAAEGHLIVGSRFAHRCRHLADRHLIHRVVAVKRREQLGAGVGQGRAARVRLATEELPSFTHAVEFMSFNFSYMPVEARDYVPFPEMRTDFGQNRSAREPRSSEEDRRLFGMPKALKKMMHIHSVEDDGGDSEVTTNPFGDTDSTSGGFHFEPKQVSNFGWNWNFAMNTTQEPNISVNLPGAKGMFEVHRPFIKVHAGLFLNFTSEFSGIIKSPKVNWRAGIDGHGYVQARVLTKMNTTSSAGIDPFKVLNYPTLRQLERPRWFQKVDFAAAMVPISFEPGFQFNTQLYHSGTFDGVVSFGGKTHGTVQPTLTYDSNKGFDAKFKGRLLDTEIWPPLWMIFTKHFELGVTGVPALLMKGDFLGFEKATAAIEMMPYINITVTREGAHPAITGETRTLTVYPVRVMGLPAAAFSKKYKVKVQANDMEVETAGEANWGQVEYHEHVSAFDLGAVPIHALKENDILVTLLEVEEGSEFAGGTPLGFGSFRCQSVAMGECRPSPAIVPIRTQEGEDVASVQLVVLWHSDPKPLLASKIHGVSVAVTELAVRPGGIDASQPLSAHLVQGGLTYVASIHKSPDEASALLSASTTFEFRPAFVDAWKPCPPAGDQGLKCDSARLEIFAGSEKVAVAGFPQQQWAATAAAPAALDGDSPSSSTLTAIPLAKPGNETDFLAVLKVNVTVSSPTVATSFLEPRSAQQVPPGAATTLRWMIRDAAKEKQYTFNLMAFKLGEPSDADKAKFVNYPKVGTATLMPLPTSAESVVLQCEQVAVMGLPAEVAPCSFTHGLDLSRFSPAVGDRFTLLLDWSDGGSSHVVYSPPFEIASDATAAPSAAPGGAAPDAGSGARRLQQQPAQPTRHPWTNEAWNQKISKHQRSCAKKDLHFALGAGILLRGRLKNGGLLKGLNMMGGHLETPELTTGYRRIAAIKPNTDARDLLPDSLCADGLCEGALPGCSPGGGSKKFYPKLVFDMNRPYHFNKFTKGHFNGLMKRAMAYAFSAMPMMLNVALKEMKERGGLFGHGRRPPPGAPVGPAAWEQQSRRQPSLPFFGGGHSSSPSPPPPSVQVSGASLSGWDTGGTSASAPAATAAPVAAPPAGGVNANIFNQWYSRRLSAIEDAGDPEEAEPLEGEELEPHQVAVSFKEGVDFEIDRPLVELMLKHGYFQDMEDDASEDLGPLRITGFRIEDSGPLPKASSEPGAAEHLPASALARLRGVAAWGGVLAVSLAVAAVARRQLQRRVSKAPSRQLAADFCPAE